MKVGDIVSVKYSFEHMNPASLDFYVYRTGKLGTVIKQHGVWSYEHQWQPDCYFDVMFDDSTIAQRVVAATFDIVFG